jgi:hypothetical protein
MDGFVQAPRTGAPVRATLIALLVAAALFATPCATASASPRPLTTGVSYVYTNDETSFQQVARTGAQLVQTPLRWASVAPQQRPASWDPENPADPHYNWEWIDLWVTRAVRAGLTPLLEVRGAPRWAQGCATSEVDAVCKPDPTALAQFAVAAARRYSGQFGGLPRVRYWQGLNEPNLSLYFTPQYEGNRAVSADLYRPLINSFYAAIKSVNPSNLVLSAGLGPIAIPHYTVGPLRFARELLCLNRHNRPLPGSCEGGVHFDIFDVHPYTTGGPTHEGGPNDVELGDIPKLVKLLRAADRAGRIAGAFRHTPLWITEFSWDSKPPDPGGLPMGIETRWVAETLYRTWRAGVSNFFWFSLTDSPTEGLPFSQTLQSGLYFLGRTPAQDRPKKVLYAFRFPFVAYPRSKGLFFWGRTPDSGPGTVAIQLRQGNRWRRVATIRAAGNGIFQGTVPTAYGHDHHGSARAVFDKQIAVPFSMKPVPDFRQRPFG